MLARFLVDDFCWWYTLTKLRFFKGEPGFCDGDKIEFCFSSRQVFTWLEMIYVWFKFLYLLDAVPIVLVLRWACFEFLVLWFNATWEMPLLAMWLLFPSYLLLVTLLKLNCIVLFSEFLLELWFLEFDFCTSRFFTDPINDVALFFRYLDVLLGYLSIDYRLKTVWSRDCLTASWDFLLLCCFFRADEYVSTFPLAAYDNNTYGIACLEVP